MQGMVSVYRVWFGKNATDVGLTSWLHENGKLLRMIRRLRQKNAKKMRLGKMIGFMFSNMGVHVMDLAGLTFHIPCLFCAQDSPHSPLAFSVLDLMDG